MKAGSFFTSLFVILLIAGLPTAPAAAREPASSSVPAPAAPNAACTVLLVDDDWDWGSAGGRPYYTTALDALAVSYGIWDTVSQGTPATGDMAPYDAVVWFTGYDWEMPISSTEELELIGYLAAGGNVFLSDQEQNYAYGITPLMSSYFWVDTIADDVTLLDPAGNAADPLFAGLGPYAMARPDAWNVYWPTEPYQGPYDDEVHVKAGGYEPFVYAAEGTPNSTRYDGGTFKTVYLGWPFEWLPNLADRVAVLGTALEWMCSPGDTATWVGPSPGNWNDPTRWDIGRVPDAFTHAVLPPGSQVILTAYAACNNLTIFTGATLDLDTYALAVAGTVDNGGTLIARHAVAGDGPVQPFAQLMDPAGAVVKYRGADVSAVGNLGTVTVNVRAVDRTAGEYCTDDGPGSPPYADRCFEITSQYPLSATVRLWALLSEFTSFPPGPSAVYRYSGSPGGTWVQLMDSASFGLDGNYAYAEANTPGFSHFLLGAPGIAPTAIEVTRGAVRAEAVDASTGALGLLALAASLALVRRIRRQASS